MSKESNGRPCFMTLVYFCCGWFAYKISLVKGTHHRLMPTNKNRMCCQTSLRQLHISFSYAFTKQSLKNIDLSKCYTKYKHETYIALPNTLYIIQAFYNTMQYIQLGEFVSTQLLIKENYEEVLECVIRTQTKYFLKLRSSWLNASQLKVLF